jgi:hypothetical protein
MTKYETVRICPDVKMNASRFAVAGLYSNDDSRCVIHAGLIDESTELQHGEPVTLFHMAPPLITESAESNSRYQPVDIVSVVGLTSDELYKMEEWRYRVSAYVESDEAKKLKGPFRQYVIHPHKCPVLSELKRLIGYRFSCVGLVIDCYESAGIATIAIDHQMPEIDEEVLQQTYPQIARLESIHRKKPEHKILLELGFRGIRELGLGDKPWKPILVGYLFHSLSRFNHLSPRPPAYIPHSVEDRFF